MCHQGAPWCHCLRQRLLHRLTCRFVLRAFDCQAWPCGIYWHMKQIRRTHMPQVAHLFSSHVKAESEGTPAAAMADNNVRITDPPLQEQLGKKGSSCPSTATQVESAANAISAAQHSGVPGTDNERTCGNGTSRANSYKQLQLPFRNIDKSVAAGCAAAEPVKPPKARQCATSDQGLAPADLLDAAPRAVETESGQLGATAGVADVAHGSRAKQGGSTNVAGTGGVLVAHAAACMELLASKPGRRRQRRQPQLLPHSTLVIDLTADSE